MMATERGQRRWSMHELDHENREHEKRLARIARATWIRDTVALWAAHRMSQSGTLPVLGVMIEKAAELYDATELMKAPRA